MKEGEEITLCDGAGKDYLCYIDEITDKCVTCSIAEATTNGSEPSYKATVYQALAKGDRFDTVIQKSVECGAYRIVPVMTKRCTVKLEKKDFEKKCARWNKIAEEAAKQCGRGIVPTVAEPVTLDVMLEEFAGSELPLFCYEEGYYPIRAAVEKVSSPDTVAILIGPEGGFAEEEARAVAEAGILPVSLGKRILRTESAAPFVLACLSFAYEQ